MFGKNKEGRIALEEERERLRYEMEKAFSADPPDMAEYHRLNKLFQVIDEKIRKEKNE